MDNYLLLKESLDLNELSKKLGFHNCLFLDKDFVLVTGNEKQILKQLIEAKGKKTIYFAENEKMLRFVLEKTKVDIIIGMEKLFAKDSVHFVKSGLDQVFCKIAAEKGKIICFSFAELLNSDDKGKLMARMKFNIKLCRKYKVKMLLGNFSSSLQEMRSAKDLQAVFLVLNKD